MADLGETGPVDQADMVIYPDNLGNVRIDFQVFVNEDFNHNHIKRGNGGGLRLQ